jgi:hypothetical protein
MTMETRTFKKVVKFAYILRASSIALAMMIALVLGMAGVARAQQEVAPEHHDYDPPLYAQTRNVSRKASRGVKKIAGHRSKLTARAHRTKGQPEKQAGI